jgi:paraquat-inducible protein A
MLYVSIGLRYRYIPGSLNFVFKWYHRIDEWGMLEVYMLSIIVALVKLRDMAEVILGLGFYLYN